MPIFRQNNVHSLKITMLSCRFFLIFHEKHPAVMPIFGKKTFNFAKTTLYYGPIKSIEWHFFPIFDEKINALMPIYCPKNINSLKSILLSCPYIARKRPFSQKHVALMSFSYIYLHQKPPPVIPILGQKTSILSKLYYMMGQKSQWKKDIIFWAL